MAKLLVPNSKTRQPPKKTGNAILDLWFEAQYEIDCGQMPTLVKKNEASLKNMGRVRAPTTWETLQSTIDQNTSVQKEKNAEAGDYSDDEEDDEEIELSASAANGVRSSSPEPVNRGDSIRRKWFKAQSQITEGKNPSILKKHGNDYRIEDLRKHNKRFQNASKGSDGFLKFAVNFSAPRKSIAADMDENGDDDEVMSMSATGSTGMANEGSFEMRERGIDPISNGKEEKNWSDVNIDAVDSLAISPAPTPKQATTPSDSKKSLSNPSSTTGTTTTTTNNPDSTKQATATSTKRSNFFGFGGFSKSSS